MPDRPSYREVPSATDVVALTAIVAVALLAMLMTVAQPASAVDEDEVAVVIDTDFHHLGDHWVPTYQPQLFEGIQHDFDFQVQGVVENPAIKLWMRGQVPAWAVPEDDQIKLFLNDQLLGYLNEYAVGDGSIYTTDDEVEIEVSIEEGILKQGTNRLTILTGWGTSGYTDRDDIMFWNIRLIKARPIVVSCDLLSPEPGTAANAGMDRTSVGLLVWNDRHVDAIQWATVTVDPGGAGTAWTWTQRTNAMALGAGATAHADFTTSWWQTDKDIVNRTWLLTADMAFKWSFPTEGPVNIVVVVRDDQTRMHTFTFSSVLTVRTRLVLDGPVQVVTDGARPLGPGSWVRGGANVSVVVPPVVYGGSDGMRPRPGTAKLSVLWDLVLVAHGAPSDGGVWGATTVAPYVSRMSSILEVRVVGLPDGARGPEPVAVPLEVDGRGPAFTSLLPSSNGQWLRERAVEVRANATDWDGIGVDPFSIQFQVWPAGATGWGPWLPAGTLPDAPTGDATGVTFVMVPEGRGSRVRWRAADRVGNGPTVSGETVLDVDTTPVAVRSAEVPGWQRSREVLMSCSVVDLVPSPGVVGSGVAPASVEWSALVPGADGWTPWRVADSVVLTGGPDEPRSSVDAFSNVSLEEGAENLVVWRATDAALNLVVVSDPVRVKVDVTAPAAVESWPRGNNTFPWPEDVGCALVLTDGDGSGVDPGAVEWALSAGSRDAWGEWAPADVALLGGALVRATCSPTIAGHDNWVRWRATDIAGNGPVGLGQVRLAVNLPPTAVIGSPAPLVRLSSEEPFGLSATGSSDPDPADVLTFTWTSDVDGGLGAGEQLTAMLTPGWHNLTVRVDDGLGGDHVATATVLVLVEEPSSPEPPFPSWMLLLLAILVAGTVAIVYERRRRRLLVDWGPVQGSPPSR
jgi:hypothetical protein